MGKIWKLFFFAKSFYFKTFALRALRKIIKTKKIFKKYTVKGVTSGFSAFSLLEIAISLAVIGILVLSVIKGQELLRQAKIEKTKTQIESLRIAVEVFNNTYHSLPGDFNDASLLPAAKYGNGDSFINSAEEKLAFWEHLGASGLLSSTQPACAPLGGIFSIEHDPRDLKGHWFLLSNAGKGVLSPKEAVTLKLKIDGKVGPSEGIIRIKNGDGTNECIEESSGAIKNSSKKVCVIFIEFP